MIKGAFIFAVGSACGLFVGTVTGMALAIKVSDAIKKIAEATEVEVDSATLHVQGTTTINDTPPL